MTSKRFPDYQPSTALRQAITRYREVLRENGRAAAEAGKPADAAAPGQLGQPWEVPERTQASGEGTAGKATSGREDTSTAPQLGADALTSGRKGGEDGAHD